MDPTQPNMARTKSDHKKFVSELGYLAAFSNAGSPELSDSRVMLKTTPHSALFDPRKN